MKKLIQATPAYELSAVVKFTAHGYTLKFISFVPTARRPEEQVQYQGLFSSTELVALRDLIDQALATRSANGLPDCLSGVGT